MSSKSALYFPNVLAIRLLEESGAPVSGVAVMLTLHARRKNDYHMIPAPSDSRGWVFVHREWVEKQIEIDRNLFVMDYASSLAECDANVLLKVISQEELSRAISAMQLYGEALGEYAVELRDLQNASNAEFFPQETVISLNLPDQTSREVLIVLKKVPPH